MKQLLQQFSNTAKGLWLHCFNYEAIPIKQLPFKLQGLITAAYITFPSQMIYTAEDKNQAVYFGTIVHQLYHACQRHTMGLLKYWMMKLFRRSNLQKQAKQMQLQAVQWYGDMKLQQMSR